MSTLDDWVARLGTELGVEMTVDISSLLELAREAAHGVDRPAAPLTTFLVGYAAAQAGGGPEAVAAAIRQATLLTESWAAAHPADPR